MLNSRTPAVDARRHDGIHALAAAIFASGMAFIDSTVVNVATAKLQSVFGATMADLQWVVEAYALMLSALLLVGGSLGDMYGQKRVFAWGNVLFGASSLWCGLAGSLPSLILARAAQGVAAALLIPGSLALITSTHPPTARGRAIGIWSGATAIMGAIGPFLGGWLIDHVSWRAVFFINVPIAALAVLFVWQVEETRRPEHRHSLNWLGAASMAGALAAVTYSLLSVQNKGTYAAEAAVACVVLLIVFAISERRATMPLLPAALLKSSVFAGVNAITLFLYGALYGAMYFFPLCLIQVHGYTASQAGAALAPLILTLFVLSPWTGKLLAICGARISLTIGCCVVTAGFAGIAIPGIGGTYWATFFVPMLILGLGMSICVSPLTTTVMNSAPTDHLGIASAINNAVSRVAGLLTIAIFGLILSMGFNTALDRSLDRLKPVDSIRADVVRQKPLLASVQYADPSLQRAVEASFVDAFRVVMGCSSVLTLIAAACAWNMLKPKESQTGKVPLH